ncbi:MAG: hypothetical protein Hals2KO_27520 [Halioglobus sp.]
MWNLGTSVLEVLKKGMESLSRAVVSDRLLEDSFAEARRRTPILVGMLSISAASALMITFALGVIYWRTDNSLFLIGTLIATITMLGYVGTLWYFRRSMAWLPASHLYALTTTFSTVAPCMITGGLFSSPYLPLVLIVPAFLFLIAGRRWGTCWSVIVALCVGAMYFMEWQGFTFPQAIPADMMAQFRFMAWLMTLMLLVLGLVSYEVNFENLTERISAERSQFAHDAMHDPLTGLSNRKLFYQRAREAVEYALHHDHKAALIFIDLNDFKRVNDSFGHEVGDEVLNEIAHRLRANVRSMDTVSRLGGDEFAVVMHGINHTDATEAMLEKLSFAIRKPLAMRDTILNISGSFGVAIAPDEGIRVEDLLHTADQAMYEAKQLRKDSQLAAG